MAGRDKLWERVTNEGTFGIKKMARAAILSAAFFFTWLWESCGLMNNVRARRIYFNIYAIGKNIFDRDKVQLLRNHLRPGDVFVDIGGAFGFFSQLASRLVGPRGKVLALEPDPMCARYIEDVIQSESRSNIELRKAAAWSETAQLRLHLCKENPGENSLFKSPIHEQSTVVQAVRLDDCLPPGERVSLVKIDVQGAEYHALFGMQRIIKESPGLMVLCEFCPDDLKLAGVEPGKLIEFLLERGFEIQRLDKEPAQRVADASDLDDLSHQGQFRQCDLLCRRLPE